MKKIPKPLILITLVILFITAGIFLLGQKKDATLLHVNVKINTSTPTPLIEDITANIEPTNKLSLPKGGPLKEPGITIIVIKDKEPISDWYSVELDKTKELHTIQVGLNQKIEPGDTIRVVARIISKQGKDEFSIAKDITI